VDESCSTELDPQANEEIPGPHAMPEFIAIFTEARHMFLYVVKLTKLTSSGFYLRPILILSPDKCLNHPSGLFSAVLRLNFVSDFQRICRHINIW